MKKFGVAGMLATNHVLAHVCIKRVISFVWTWF